MITSLRLENFKNFANETLRVGPFTVIVGANASGKSNIRDAFRVLHGIGRGYSFPEVIGGKYGGGGQLEWEPIRGGTTEIVRMGQSGFTLQVGLDHKTYAIHVTPGPSKHSPFSSTGESYPSSDHRQTIYDALANMRFFDLIPGRMRQPAFPGQIVLGDSGENLPTVLHAIHADPDRRETLIQWTRELTPMDVRDFKFPVDGTSGLVQLVICEANGREVSAYAASDGTLRFLAILAALLGGRPKGLYFFEELDTGIHPARLSLLIELIERQTARGNVQVVTTTHAPDMLTFVSDSTFENMSVVCRLEDSQDAIIRPVAELPNARELRTSGRGLGGLLAEGWMETALAFTENNGEAREVGE